MRKLTRRTCGNLSRNVEKVWLFQRAGRPVVASHTRDGPVPGRWMGHQEFVQIPLLWDKRFKKCLVKCHWNHNKLDDSPGPCIRRACIAAGREWRRPADRRCWDGAARTWAPLRDENLVGFLEKRWLSTSWWRSAWRRQGWSSGRWRSRDEKILYRCASVPLCKPVKERRV